MTIARLRLVFAALAVALAIPGALLVERVLSSVAAERAARERAVAERVFDETERALSELLRAEEARPASDYDFASPASPLRAKPEGSLALGWFQVEADGTVATPPWAERVAGLGAEIAEGGARYEVAKASAGPSARPKPRIRTEPERIELPPASASPAIPESAPTPPAFEKPVLADPASVQTAADEIAGEADGGTMVPTPSRAARQDASADAYDALAKLNTGAKEREQRTQRVYVQEQAAAAAPSVAATAKDATPQRASEHAPEAQRAGALADDSRARSEQLVARAMSAPSASSEWSEPQAERDAGAPSAAGESAERRQSSDAAPTSGAIDSERKAETLREEPRPPAEEGAVAALEESPKRKAAGARGSPSLGRVDARARSDAPSSELVRVVVDPLRGRLAKSGELLLVRSAWIGARGVRQGVAFEVAALERALAAASLGDGALPGASLRLAPAAQRGEAEPAAGALRFSHRFAEPFDALAAELSFAPFADFGARSVYWLAALFSLAGAGGLFAVYRMTAVALHFAERRSNFAAAVSHELKTPLTAIRLYAEMLRDGLVAGEEKRREYYGSISAETERLSRLINNVLEFSRLEQGARKLEISVGDVAPVVREAVELLRPHAAAHAVALELALDDSLPPARFERDALLQIVFNLVDNAVKYGRGEPARIEIACRRAGVHVAVVVRDHGKGVPREELARILEPFYRRGDELTRSAQGAGIGLALVRSLAQQMGAALAVANAEGGGLAVTLELSGGGARA
ncbi:MAG TPA: ATP-binding protein [Myxococcota bacterium]